MLDSFGFICLFFAAVIAGAMNSVAGGGTLVSFPALVAFGVPTILANATNAASLWPGSFSSAIAYRKDTPQERGLLLTLLIPSVLGSLSGAAILALTPEELFRKIVPLLVLFATLVFAAKDVLARWVNGGQPCEGLEPSQGSACVTAWGRVWGFLFQLFIAIYGGYFGAGMGILMLSSYSIMGLSDIHEMNGLKTIMGAVINMIAFIYFALRGIVLWHLALWMALGAIVGGYAGARLAKRIDQRALRAFVIVVGLVVSVWLFVK